MADKKHRLLIDAGLLLDCLRAKAAGAEASAGVLSVVEAGLAEGWISVTDLAKVNTELHAGLSSAQARSVMQELVSLLKISPVNQSVVTAALALGWNDFESAITAALAQSQRMDHLITRNPRAYRSLQQSVLTPEEYLAKHLAGRR